MKEKRVKQKVLSFILMSGLIISSVSNGTIPVKKVKAHTKAGVSKLAGYEDDNSNYDYDSYYDYYNDYDSYYDAVPDKIIIKTVENQKTDVTVTWYKDSSAASYEVSCSLNEKFTKSVQTFETSETSYTFKNLKKGTMYYFKVRGIAEGSRNTGSWSEVKDVMIIGTSGTVKITAKADIENLQETLDLALTNKKVKFVVKLPKGTYKTQRRIYVHSNTTLDLRGVTIKRASGYIGPMLRVGELTGGKYNAGKNIKIQGGVFDGGTKSSVADICCFSHVQNVTIDGCVFKYLPAKKLRTGDRNSHIIEFGASKNVIITNCKFYNNKNCFANNEAIQIESLYANMAGTTPADLGKRDGTQCSNITIQKCYFSAFNYGCGSNHLSKKDHFTNMKFIKNTFVGAKKYAICLYGYRNVTIKGNKLKNSGQLVQNIDSKGVKISK